MGNLSKIPGVKWKATAKRQYNKLFLLMLLPFLVTVNACLNAEFPTSIVYDTNPPPNTYPGPVQVSFIIQSDQWDTILYTLDGQNPVEGCLEWTPGQPIEIAETLILKYVLVKNGVFGEIRSAAYTIQGTGGGGGLLTNKDMLVDWVEFEAETRQLLNDKYFQGCEPVVGCSGSEVDLNELGTWTICEGEDGTPGANTTPQACAGASLGSITWTIAGEGLDGTSEFNYVDYTYASLASGCTMTAEMGRILGLFNISKTGKTSTGTGITITLSGDCYNGTIDEAVVVTAGQKTGGIYQVFCSDMGCSSNVEVYLVSPGPNFNLFVPPNVEPSCEVPTYMIQSKWNNKCITAGANTIYSSLCTNYASQQWEPIPDVNTPNDYQLRSVSTGECISTDISNFFLLYTPTMVACDQFQSDNKQRLTITGNSPFITFKPDVLYTSGQLYRCLGVDLNQNANGIVSWVNCGDVITQFNVYENGQFPAINSSALP